MSDVREIIAKALHEVRFMSYGDDKRADAILAALEENGMVVVSRELVMGALAADGRRLEIKADPTLPDDVVEFRHPDGRVDTFFVGDARPAGTVKEG